MPKEKSGIRITKNTVTPHAKLIQPNIRAALETGMHESMGKSTDAMFSKVNSSVTRTGLERAAGAEPRYSKHSDGRPTRPAWYDGKGPGRRETDNMIRSIKSLTKKSGNQVVGKAGFIDAPAYTAVQEIGTSAVKGMRAYEMGRSVMAAAFKPTMDKYVGLAIQDASNGKSTKGV